MEHCTISLGVIGPVLQLRIEGAINGGGDVLGDENDHKPFRFLSPATPHQNPAKNEASASRHAPNRKATSRGSGTARIWGASFIYGMG